MSKEPKDYFHEHAEAPPPSLTVVKDSTVIFVYPFPYCYKCCLVFSSSITNYYFFVRKLQTLLQSNNLSCCPSLISHFPFHGCYIKFLNIERNFFFLFCQFQLLTLFFVYTALANYYCIWYQALFHVAIQHFDQLLYLYLAFFILWVLHFINIYIFFFFSSNRTLLNVALQKS